MNPADDTPEVLLRYDGFLRRLARGLVAQSADADDLVQQALVTALRARCGLVGDLRSWLEALVRNVASNERRARRAAARP